MGGKWGAKADVIHVVVPVLTKHAAIVMVARYTRRREVVGSRVKNGQGLSRHSSLDGARGGSRSLG